MASFQRVIAAPPPLLGAGTGWQPAPVVEPRVRDGVYGAALDSLESYPTCRAHRAPQVRCRRTRVCPPHQCSCARADFAQAVLDAVLDPCLADRAPFEPVPNPGGARFPPMPDAVERAEAATPSPPPPVAQLRPSAGAAFDFSDATAQPATQAKWGEA